jgi:hypothetical protein
MGALERRYGGSGPAFWALTIRRCPDTAFETAGLTPRRSCRYATQNGRLIPFDVDAIRAPT